MKRKPVRFKDVTLGDTAEPNPDVEVDTWAEVGGRSEFGRSTIVIRCPFCTAHITAFLWSLAGGGKRCACGALFGGRGTAYRWRS